MDAAVATVGLQSPARHTSRSARSADRSQAPQHRPVTLREYATGLRRLLANQVVVRRLEQQCDAVYAQLDEVVVRLAEMTVVERKTHHLSHTTTSLVRRLSEQSWHSDAIRNAVAQRRDHMVARLDRLLDATQAILACASEDHCSASALDADAQRERISDITLRLETRRAKLLLQLQTLYPIEMPTANVPLQSRCYVIRGVQVPVVDSIALLDDDTMSAALGYVCHLVLMISKFMDIPLRYKIHYRCSRSFVTDEVSPIPGHNEYPLYMKGVERAKFECGVILLNRVVDQILRNRNLDTACCQTRGENPARLLENLSRLFANELP